MATSKRLERTLLTANQASAEVTANQILYALDAFAGGAEVLDRDLNAPPGSPTEGDLYIIGPSPTGLWATHAGKLGLYYGGWLVCTPKGGMQVFIKDEKAFYAYSSQESLWFPTQEIWSTSEEWTGRYDGATKVYAKSFDLGTSHVAGVNAVAHSITGLDITKRISFKGFAYLASPALSFSFPQMSIDFAGVYVDCHVNGTNLFVNVGATIAGVFTIKLRMEYCK